MNRYTIDYKINSCKQHFSTELRQLALLHLSNNLPNDLCYNTLYCHNMLTITKNSSVVYFSSCSNVNWALIETNILLVEAGLCHQQRVLA